MKNSQLPKTSRLLSICVLAFVVVATSAYACQVPVFRYALERWPADRYEILIIHDGPLSDADQDRLQVLKASDSTAAIPANFDVRSIELGSSQDEVIVGLWKQHEQREQPLMAVLYPRNAKEVPDRIVDAMVFTDAAIASLIDSPVRKELTKQVISGESAVWIFVPSGDETQDSIALDTLNKQVVLNTEQLELPEQEEAETEDALLKEVDIELRIGFSVVTLKRDDPKEQFLLKMLLASEPDLEQLDQPMAFPVLGRGRVLYALVGKGINRDTIGMASRFIVGPCSCQVKEQNPGFDLLLSYDWETKIAGSTISDPLPENTGKPKLLNIAPGRTKK